MEKEISRALRPFQRKLAAEAGLRAACVSGVCVLPIWFALALVRHCFGGVKWQMEAWMLIAWIVLATILFILCYRPTQKRVAARLDVLCGMDRVATAMEFSDDSSVLCRLQRADTAQRLAEIDMGSLHLHWPKPLTMVCCV